jgi:peptidoglycan/xylan/chitin deacetylase (PgdA/CDA1 family)
MAGVGFLPAMMERYSSGLVLAFHEIPPQRLADFVDRLRPGQAVSLTELVKRNKAQKPTSGLFAITVDDGVGENVRNLAQLFLARHWPATFYLPTRYVDTGEGMAFQWWRRLQSLLPRRKLELRSGVLDLSRPGAIRALSKKMELLWHSQPLESYFPLIMDLVDLITREGIASRAALQPDPPITWAEVRQLARTGLIHFESHGVTHTAMSALTDEELVAEMKHSRDVVTGQSGSPCRHLAYPFGSPMSIGNHAVAVAERFYDSAATMTMRGAAHAHPWLLPRIPLYANNSMLLAWTKTLLRYNPTSFLQAASEAGDAPSRVV